MPKYKNYSYVITRICHSTARGHIRPHQSKLEIPGYKHWKHYLLFLASACDRMLRLTFDGKFNWDVIQWNQNYSRTSSSHLRKVFPKSNRFCEKAFFLRIIWWFFSSYFISPLDSKKLLAIKKIVFKIGQGALLRVEEKLDQVKEQEVKCPEGFQCRILDDFICSRKEAISKKNRVSKMGTLKIIET